MTPASERDDGLSEALAGAILSIDLGAVRANYRLLCKAAAPAGAAAVVKADAYGLGVAAVAPALAAEGCRAFFVAQATEGLELREVLGPGPEIHVLNGADGFKTFLLHSASALGPTGTDHRWVFDL